MKSKKYEALAEVMAEIFARHTDEIAALSREGERGGVNARRIPGWSRSPGTAVSRIARKNPLWHLNWWHGSAPTPGTAIPTCVLQEVTDAYNRLYKEV